MNILFFIIFLKDRDMSSPPTNSQWFSRTNKTFVEVIKVNDKEYEITYKNLLNQKVRSNSIDDFLKINEPLTLDTSLHNGIPKVCSKNSLDSIL